ncbi:hypothetical protein ZIOFF_068997 [Zingiber officinale]|uniref:Uncharacterized protein n=1 Tax=Zingiber officinale TaxID=94328 RepID=A0A8J5CAB7_ZINOF|nr:hypothetical protein ZIOFF_068997 [Zingiber officinale]
MQFPFEIRDASLHVLLRIRLLLDAVSHFSTEYWRLALDSTALCCAAGTVEPPVLKSVLNKIDLPGAEPDRIAQEIAEIIGLDCSNAIHCSAKEITETAVMRFIVQQRRGITEFLNAIITRIPPPKDISESPMRALIFDR